MKKALWLGLLFIVLGWIACGPPEAAISTSEDLARCEAGLHAIWKLDTVALHHDSVLTDIIPEKIEGFQSGSRQGATYHGSKRGFAETEIRFQSPSGKTLRYQVRDYGHDTAALHMLWREFMDAEKGESPHPFAQDVQQYGGCSNMFIWRWADKRNAYMHVEAVSYARYHLTISTDAPAPALQKAWDAIPWKNWKTLGIEPQAFSVQLAQ